MLKGLPGNLPESLAQGLEVLYRLLKSRKFAVFLFVLLLLLVILEAGTGIVSGYAFIGFAVPLGLNLLFCLFDHVRKINKLNFETTGFVLFHASFLLIIFGGTVTFLTYSIGFKELAEGQGFVDRQEHYTAWKQRFGTRESTGAEIYLKKVNLDFWENGQIKEFNNEILIRDGEAEQTAQIDVNGSVRYKNLLINLSRHYGLAPYFTLITSHGSESGFVNIREDTKSNSFTIPGVGRKAFVSYNSITDGRIYLRISGDEGKEIEMSIGKGESIPLGKSRLELTDIKLWNGLTVVTDSGKSVMFAGFVFLLTGLAAYYTAKFRGMNDDE